MVAPSQSKKRVQDAVQANDSSNDNWLPTPGESTPGESTPGESMPDVENWEFCKRLFAQRLSEVRHQLGWTYDDIAYMTGISRRMAAAYELGDTPPSFKFLMALMAAKVDVMYLITGQVQDHPGGLAKAEPGDGAQRLLAAMEPLPPPLPPPPQTLNEITLLSGFRELGQRDQRKILHLLWRLQHKEDET